MALEWAFASLKRGILTAAKVKPVEREVPIPLLQAISFILRHGVVVLRCLVGL